MDIISVFLLRVLGLDVLMAFVGMVVETGDVFLYVVLANIVEDLVVRVVGVDMVKVVLVIVVGIVL